MPRPAFTFVFLAIALGAAGAAFWFFSLPPARQSTNVAGEATDFVNSPCSNSRCSSRNSNAPPNQPGNQPRTGNGPEKPPANTGEVEKPRPEPVIVKMTPRPVVAPLLDWSLTEADCKRIVRDPNSTAEQRDEAEARQLSDFTRWPGRDTPRLGGYLFVLANYPELVGFTEDGIDRLWVGCDAETPNVVLERTIQLSRDPAYIYMKAIVRTSRGWAQRHFLSSLWSRTTSARKAPPRPASERGIFVGDVCDGDALDEPQTQGTLNFVRHNVTIEIKLWVPGNKKSPFQVNLVALAQRIDREIQSQSHLATTWEDLDKFRPVIDELYVSSHAYTEFEGSLEFPVVYSVHHPQGKKYTLFKNCEVGGGGLLLGKKPSLRVGKETLKNGRAYNAWLVAYDDSMLFSVAQISLAIEPPKPK